MRQELSSRERHSRLASECNPGTRTIRGSLIILVDLNYFHDHEIACNLAICPLYSHWIVQPSTLDEGI